MKKLFKSSALILSTFLTLSSMASTPGEPKPVKSSSVSWTASKVTGTHSGIITLGDSHLEMDGDRIVGGLQWSGVCADQGLDTTRTAAVKGQVEA